MKESKILETYQKVGRLRQPVAKAIRRKAANIYINDNHLRHILNRHAEELASVGLDPITLVCLVVNNFNRIYKGKGQSLLLTIYNGKPKVTAIELNFAIRKGFYEVKTATITRKTYLKDEDLLWQK
jgi:hypothetical protein